MLAGEPGRGIAGTAAACWDWSARAASWVVMIRIMAVLAWQIFSKKKLSPQYIFTTYQHPKVHLVYKVTIQGTFEIFLCRGDP